MTMEPVFPPQFAHLEKYAAWALPTERERLNKKCKAPMAELEELYGVLNTNIDAIIAYLNTLKFDEIAGSDKRLMDFACCFVTLEVSIAGWRSPDLADILPVERWEVVDERW